MHVLNRLQHLKQNSQREVLCELTTELLAVICHILALQFHNYKALLLNVLLVDKLNYWYNPNQTTKLDKVLKLCHQDPACFVGLLYLQCNVTAAGKVNGLVYYAKRARAKFGNDAESLFAGLTIRLLVVVETTCVGAC
jgi:hypothetical protein